MTNETNDLNPDGGRASLCTFTLNNCQIRMDGGTGRPGRKHEVCTYVCGTSVVESVVVYVI